MDRETLERSVRSFVAEASGLDSKRVIPGNSSSPRPNVPYATVLRMNTEGRGIDSVTYSDGETDVDATVKGVRHATFSVQFYRDGAYDNAETLLQYPATPAGNISLFSKGLRWVRASEVRQVDTLISDRMNDRAAVDITVRYVHTITQTVNRIDTIDLTVNHSQETDTREEVNINE